MPIDLTELKNKVDDAQEHVNCVNRETDLKRRRDCIVAATQALYWTTDEADAVIRQLIALLP